MQHAMSSIFRHLSLAVVLFAFWLVLSGHYTVLLTTIGVVCVLGVVALGWHMSVVDSEGHPIQLAIGAITYWPWLFWQIAKSAWGVSKLIVDPGLPISPTLVKVKPSQKTSAGVNVYANSITLTPGTISVEADRDEIMVHAITSENAEQLSQGEMDRRVTRFEGRS